MIPEYIKVGATVFTTYNGGARESVISRIDIDPFGNRIVWFEGSAGDYTTKIREDGVMFHVNIWRDEATFRKAQSLSKKVRRANQLVLTLALTGKLDELLVDMEAMVAS